MSSTPFLLGVLKLGNIGTSPLLELLFDERAERENFDVVLVGSGAKMNEEVAERSAKLLIEQKPQLVLIPSPNAALKGPAKARELVKNAGIPVIILSDLLPKDQRDALAAEGYGYILLPADSMIGARREFLDPTEMALFNADVIRVLAATGALRRVTQALEEVIVSIAAGKKPKVPTLVVNASRAVNAGKFTNPYARAKAMAAYEIATAVAPIAIKGCFKQKEHEKYIPTVASAHEMMRTAALLADEAREIEKYGDSLHRSPHFDDGTVGSKTKLAGKPAKPK
ncbi:MAG: F420-dependent methylenetetrahydromethanopterin dehydrogenase [Candidatus Odinarchaeota archaeon]